MIRWLSLLLATLALGACRTAVRPTEAVQTSIRFFIESAESRSIPMVLPQSGVRVPVAPTPILTETDIANVEVAQLELGECLVFKLTPTAVRNLGHLTENANGRRLIVAVNGAPIGARRLDAPIGSGLIAVFVEVPDADLGALVTKLKGAIHAHGSRSVF